MSRFTLHLGTSTIPLLTRNWGYPTQAQVEFLNGELREACSLYKAALQERIGAYRFCGKSINRYDQANQLKAMRQDGCLTSANFSCCQDVLRRLDTSPRSRLLPAD